MKSRFWVAFVVLMLVLIACSDGDDVSGTGATSDPTQIPAPTPTELPTQTPAPTTTPTEQPTQTPAPTATDEPTAAGTVEPSDAVPVSVLFDGEGERQATVRGFVVWTDAGARLCEVLAESFPPQCEGLWVVIANPGALDVVLESEGVVSWTEGFVNVDGFFDGNRFIVHQDSVADTEPSVDDVALAEAFLDFATDPSADRFVQLDLAESVSLGLSDEVVKTVLAAVLIDPAQWTIEREEFQGWAGPFSALVLVERPVIITIGSHPRCVAEPVAAPPGFADHRRVSLQPENATSCLEWWTVDFFVDQEGSVEAITLDLFAP